jgi:hypothetical protein
MHKTVVNTPKGTHTAIHTSTTSTTTPQ